MYFSSKHYEDQQNQMKKTLQNLQKLWESSKSSVDIFSDSVFLVNKSEIISIFLPGMRISASENSKKSPLISHLSKFMENQSKFNFHENIKNPRKIHRYPTRYITFLADERTKMLPKLKKKYILILGPSAKLADYTREVAKDAEAKILNSKFSIRLVPAFNSGSQKLNEIESMELGSIDPKKRRCGGRPF